MEFLIQFQYFILEEVFWKYFKVELFLVQAYDLSALFTIMSNREINKMLFGSAFLNRKIAVTATCNKKHATIKIMTQNDKPG